MSIRNADHPSRWLRCLVLALVLLLTLKTTYGVLGTFDVGFDDETLYLEGAHWLGKRFLPLAESSPLYPAWYRLLLVFQPDPLRVYFVNWFVLTAAMPIILYALARRSGAPIAIAALVAIAWSISGSLLTWPFVSKFAAVILGLSALGATYVRDRKVGAAITASAMGLASYARAELEMPSYAFAGAIVLVSLVSLLRTIRPKHKHKARRARVQSLIALCVCALPPLLLHKAFGVRPDGKERAFFAFGQHYALNVVEDKKLYVDPWTTWPRYIREAFPKALTVQEAFKENPAAFFWHIKRNITTFPRTIPRLLQPLAHVPTTLVFLVVGLLAVTTLVGIVAFVLLRRRRLDPRLFAWLPLYLVLGASTAASSLIIYPRDHYVLPILWLTLALVASGWRRIRVPSFVHRRGRVIGQSLMVATLVFLLVALPTRKLGALPSLLASAETPPPPVVQENVRSIEVLRSLDLRGKVVLLESDHSRGFYTNLDYQRVAQWDKPETEGFWAFMHRFYIGVVVLNDRLRWDERFNKDPEFKAFIEGTGEREDFEMHPVPNTHTVLAIRKSALMRGK